MRPPLVIGNWKMHRTASEALALSRSIRKGLSVARQVEVSLAPPFTAFGTVRDIIKGSPILLAGQNVYWEPEGAYTGEISAKMLAEIGCAFIIVGHSERRRLFHESDEAIAKKISAALGAGLRPILCIGEAFPQRQKGLTNQVLARQLRRALKGLGKNAIRNIEIAYEPVWAIGTGRNATPDQVGDAHRLIRRTLGHLFDENRAEQTRILYGGSVRPDNAAELAAVDGVNGLLVGGASLKAPDFLRIIRCFIPARR